MGKEQLTEKRTKLEQEIAGLREAIKKIEASYNKTVEALKARVAQKVMLDELIEEQKPEPKEEKPEAEEKAEENERVEE